MIKRTLIVLALFPVCTLHLKEIAQAQTPDSKETPEISESQNKAKSPEECEALRHTAGQQKIVKQANDTAGDGTGKSAPEINKDIIANMIEKSDKSDASISDTARNKTAEEINKEIVENTKKTESGMVVAETGAAKPTENWFGCPPEKKKDE